MLDHCKVNFQVRIDKKNNSIKHYLLSVSAGIDSYSSKPVKVQHILMNMSRRRGRLQYAARHKGTSCTGTTAYLNSPNRAVEKDVQES